MNQKKKSNKIILPFYGYIFQDKCFGIKKITIFILNV